MRNSSACNAPPITSIATTGRNGSNDVCAFAKRQTLAYCTNATSAMPTIARSETSATNALRAEGVRVVLDIEAATNEKTLQCRARLVAAQMQSVHADPRA